AGRVRRRPLNMRSVVRRACSRVENLDSQRTAQLDELQSFRQIDLRGIIRIHAEAVSIRHAMSVLLGNPGTELARLRFRRIGTMRHLVKHAQSNPELDFVPTGTNAPNYLTEDSGAIFKRAAKLSGPRMRAQKLVEQVPMAMLDIHEIR